MDRDGGWVERDGGCVDRMKHRRRENEDGWIG